jgi:hypothetical protein
MYIADTDAEARKKASQGMLGRAHRDYLLPLFGAFGLVEYDKHDPNIPAADVTPDYLLDHGWLVGSPRR